MMASEMDEANFARDYPNHSATAPSGTVVFEVLDSISIYFSSVPDTSVAFVLLRIRQFKIKYVLGAYILFISLEYIYCLP